MKLLHVSHLYRPAIGGSEQYMADLSETLTRRGHQVDVITSRSKSALTCTTDLPSEETLNGVNVIRFRSLPRYRAMWHILKFGNDNYQRTKTKWYEPFILFGTGMLTPGIAWYILKHGHEYDLIHIQTLPYFHSVYGYLAARLIGKPVIITPHIHVDQPESFDLHTFNTVLRGADRIIVVSRREIPYLTERNVAGEKIVVAGNGVDLKQLPRRDKKACRARLGLPQDAFVVLFLGRKVEYKGLQVALEAYRRLRNRYPALHLVSAGPSTSHSRELVMRHGSDPRWIDFDTVSDDQKIDLLNACDTLVLPSTGEAFGIVFLEAWAVGKPVIGAGAGAIPWVISEGNDGLLAPPHDPESWAVEIEKLMTQPTLAHQMGANGYQKVLQNFTTERITDKVETACYQLLEQMPAHCQQLSN